MDKHIEDFLDLLTQESETLTNQEIVITNDIQYYKASAVFFLFVKSVKTFRSIVLLLKNGRDEDAKILLRTLMENRLTSFWLQLKGDAAFLRYRRYELVTKLKDHKKSLWQTIVKRDPEEFDYLVDQTEAEAQLNAINDQLIKLDPSFDLEEQEKIYDEKGWWAGVNTTQIAEEVSKSFKRKDDK
jgi:hypothetical protein